MSGYGDERQQRAGDRIWRDWHDEGRRDALAGRPDRSQATDEYALPPEPRAVPFDYRTVYALGYGEAAGDKAMRSAELDAEREDNAAFHEAGQSGSVRP